MGAYAYCHHTEKRHQYVFVFSLCGTSEFALECNLQMRLRSLLELLSYIPPV